EPFALQFGGKSAGVLLSHLRRMPMPPVAKPGSLPSQTYVHLLAFLLQANGSTAGDTALPADAASLADLVIPRWGRSPSTSPSRSTDAPAAPAASATAHVSVKDLPAVTD